MLNFIVLSENLCVYEIKLVTAYKLLVLVYPTISMPFDPEYGIFFSILDQVKVKRSKMAVQESCFLKSLTTTITADLWGNILQTKVSPSQGNGSDI